MEIVWLIQIAKPVMFLKSNQCSSLKTFMFLKPIPFMVVGFMFTGKSIIEPSSKSLLTAKDAKKSAKGAKGLFLV